MQNFKKYFVVVFISIIITAGYSYSETVPFNSDRWEFSARDYPSVFKSRIEDYLGKKSLFLECGFAVIKDSEFTDGIIEYDIAFSQGSGLMGAVWRVQDLENFERFYMRTHLSGKPDANQYTPFYNSISGWQLYHGKGYNASVKHKYNQWVHIKIIVSGKNAEVYIDNMDQPVLFINDLKRAIKPGKVGLFLEGVPEGLPFKLIPAHFANFSYISIANPPLKGKAKKLTAPLKGTIMAWLVSETFDAKWLDNKTRLSKNDLEKFKWEKLSSENSGMANLAKVQGIEKGKNCVFAKVKIDSKSKQIKKLSLGFSDKIKVYLNKQIIFSADDTYGSRDYRFTGLTDYYYDLYLPLTKGDNELCVAISESTFFRDGWGVQGKFENFKGITIK